MARLARWKVCPQVAGANFLSHQATPAICPSKFKITNSPTGVHRWDKLTSAKLSLYLRNFGLSIRLAIFWPVCAVVLYCTKKDGLGLWWGKNILFPCVATLNFKDFGKINVYSEDTPHRVLLRIF